MAQPKIRVGNIEKVSGEVTIAGGDIQKGFTAEQVSALITQITSTFQVKKFTGRCPYKGLDVFEEEDAELFFGREKIVDDLVGRVKESRTVFITGPSGSGKSSLVRAGLIPALRQGKIKNLHSERWLYEIMKPGRDPIAELARVASSFAGTLNAGEDIRTKGISDSTILSKWCEIALKDSRGKRAVIFIDQFEEVFTQVGKDKAEPFLNLLTQAASVEDGRVIILFAMRSDFVSNCVTYPELNDLLNRQFIQIGAMQADELVSAIAQPALRVGLRIDPDLIAQIINDMQGEPGTLPLMQFALRDLFDARAATGSMIALALSDYLQRGGIHKSLERHADDAFSKLTASEQELARSIFSGLIEIGRGTPDTKRTALFDELVPADTKVEDVQAIVGKLADARLITTDEKDERNTVTLTHEKLIDAWHWLKKLVNENRDAIALQNEIAANAKEWEKHKKDISYLYTGARLANAHEQLGAKRILLVGTANEFVRAGFARRRRNQNALLGSVSAIIVLLILAVIIFSRQSSANAQLAQQNEAIAATAQANANIALAHQLVAQASVLSHDEPISKHQLALLLAIQSMRLNPSLESADFFSNSILPLPIARISHGAGVNAVDFSPDGERVVSGGDDGVIIIWDVSSGAEITRMAHGAWVSFVAFSPDGGRVVSAGCDVRDENGFSCIQGTARVWVASSGVEIARMTHEGGVSAVDFSPGGKRAASGGCDVRDENDNCVQGAAIVWDASNGVEIGRMIHDGGVSAIDFGPDGRVVVSSGWDGTARVWNADNEREIASMSQDSWISAAVFSPDGDLVITSGCEWLLYYGESYCKTADAVVWDAATGFEISRMTSYADEVSAIAFSPDGRLAVSAGCDEVDDYGQEIRDSIRIWDATTGFEVTQITGIECTTSLVFSPDGKRLAASKNDGDAWVWDVSTWQEITHITGEYGLTSIAFSPDGQSVFTGDKAGIAQVWKISAWQEKLNLAQPGNVVYMIGKHSIAVSPEGNLVASGGAGGDTCVWDISSTPNSTALLGGKIACVEHHSFVHAVAFSPDGKWVVSGIEVGPALVWNASTGEEISVLNHKGTFSNVAFSPDGKRVVTGSSDKTARVWNAVSGEEITRMTHDSEVLSVAFSPDGKQVVSSSWDGVDIVWDTHSGAEITRLTHDGSDLFVGFSPDGGRIFSSGCVGRSGTYNCTGGIARVWDAMSGEEIAHLFIDGFVTSIAFSPDGKQVISSVCETEVPDARITCPQGITHVWDVFRGEEIARWDYKGAVISVAFSPDNNWIVVGTDNGAVSVLNTTSWQEIAHVTHHEGVSAVAFSPDGKYVISASDDGNVRVWIYLPAEMIDNACSRLPRNMTRAEWQQYIGDALPYQAICEDFPIEPEPTAIP